jgi:hypothetical protein
MNRTPGAIRNPQFWHGCDSSQGKEALDETLDVPTRMSAASIVLPYLYPRLSATQVDARVTSVNVDAAMVMEKLNARIEKLAQARPVQIEADAEEKEADQSASDWFWSLRSWRSSVSGCRRSM